MQSVVTFHCRFSQAIICCHVRFLNSGKTPQTIKPGKKIVTTNGPQWQNEYFWKALLLSIFSYLFSLHEYLIKYPDQIIHIMLFLLWMIHVSNTLYCAGTLSHTRVYVRKRRFLFFLWQCVHGQVKAEQHSTQNRELKKMQQPNVFFTQFWHTPI